MSVKVYVEGGGDTRELKQKCRRGFSEFFRKAGLAGRMPRVVSAGSRNNAFDRFRTALTNAKHGDFVVLLVDSEGPVGGDQDAWSYLAASDNWLKPQGAVDESVHLMVQCMEAWFLADKDSLARYFGSGFNLNALPQHAGVEDIPKQDVSNGLNMASRQCLRKGAYDKSRHSFDILGELDPGRVTATSVYAKRLVDTLIAKAS